MKKSQLLTYDFCEVQHFVALKRGDAIIRGMPYLEEIRYSIKLYKKLYLKQICISYKITTIKLHLQFSTSFNLVI